MARPVNTQSLPASMPPHSNAELVTWEVGTVAAGLADELEQCKQSTTAVDMCNTRDEGLAIGILLLLLSIIKAIGNMGPSIHSYTLTTLMKPIIQITGTYTHRHSMV